jgi:glutaredoxin
MKVFMYALSTCPWCRKAKNFFKMNHVAFDFVDYDLQPEAEQEKIMDKIIKISNARSFPVVMIGDQVIVGYDPEKYSKTLGLKEVKAS